ncbi:MAG: hypothetical protein AAFQ62_07440 [Pseudomonadota bacterium]
MRTSTLLGTVAAALCLALSVPAFAQDAGDERKPLSDVWLMVPKAGMEMQFEESLKTHMAMRASQGDPREWRVYVPVMGNDMDVYQFRSCCHEFADQDRYVAFTTDKGFSDHWNETVHQYIASYEHYMERNDWKHSHMPQDADPAKYYGVTAWKLKEGAGMASESARKKMSMIALENGWGEQSDWLWLTRIGGKPMLMVVSPYADFADMAPPETSFFEFVAEHVGSEEKAEKMFKKFGSGMAASTFTVWTERSDLSMPTTAQGDD